MKVATCIAAILMLAVGSALATAPTPSNIAPQAVKNSQPVGVPNPQPQVGGEDIPSAVPIPAIPYSDGGNTCGYINNYDEVCPYTGSLSPDVVYSYSPAADGAINISLCDSYYDTKVFVYENVYTPGTPYRCNDDACSGPNYPYSWLSLLECVPVVAGNTYYIVIDGYGSGCGQYVLNVDECVPCTVECPPGAIAEGEPDCGPNYVDSTNGGCNSTPNVFTNLPCAGTSLTVCGTYGGFTYNGLNYRDTDWYIINVPTGGFANVTMCIEGELPVVLGYIDLRFGCPVTSFVTYTVLEDCQYGCINAALPAGDACVWVGTNGFGPDFACGSDYVLTIDGLDCPVSIEPTTWGKIKAQFEE